MSESVATRIRRAIEEGGPITFAEFMELALYGPGGFYEQPPIGRVGHFVTSPHVHPVFGELLAGGLRQMWAALERPEPFRVVDVGAGDGTLAAQVVARLADVPLDYVAVERSPGARARLAELPVRVSEELDDAVDGGCILANELLDNMPFRRVRASPGGVVEIRIGLSADRFVEVDAPCDERLAELLPRLGPGEEAAVSLGALELVDRLADRLLRGYALLIDYGEASGRAAGRVHGYRSHQVVEDVLDRPGSADITAGVDFAALIRRAEEGGTAALGPVAQRVALRALGFDAWAECERRRSVELLDAGSGLDAVRAWAGRSRATLLIDPAALGGLQWLALATPGLAWPPWLESAAAGGPVRSHPRGPGDVDRA